MAESDKDGIVRGLCYVGLHAEGKTKLPVEYKDARQASTFMKMTKARYEMMGSRLDSLDIENFHEDLVFCWLLRRT